MANAVDFRVGGEIILECHKVSTAIETSRGQRPYKIAINKFAWLSARGCGTIMGNSLLAAHDTAFAGVLLRNILGEVHTHGHTGKPIEVLLTQMAHASMPQLVNGIGRNAVGRQGAIGAVPEIQKEEISVAGARKLQVTLGEGAAGLLEGDCDIGIEEFANRKKIDPHIGHMQDIGQGDFHTLAID